ncbi:FUSC family protein [Tessaracoccus antarcticus]|uniref:Uncharacterized protein n=1 Tax=Tessaracoccus antarcticus TaxID=2479848 RepID=A0A3M0GAX6_9ACTN|nr:hypothetical protein [Tessaracoccus antarcticus]RMB62080.1 hypothetical protein EAX62_05745 [Tessaracoccus antarcticus]
MASWTDGAAYAPIERPDGFATPEAEPLEVAVPQTAQTPGPMPTPTGFAPTGPSVPLGGIRTSEAPSRNPSEPFSTTGGLMTTSPEHEQGRDPRLPFAAYGDPVPSSGVDTLPPPTGDPLPSPMQVPMAARGVSPQQQSTQRTLVFLAVASSLIGLTIPAVGQWMLFVAGLLTFRTVPLTGRTGHAAMGVGLTLLVIGGVAGETFSDVMARLACLAFGSLFAWLAVRRSRPQR